MNNFQLLSCFNSIDQEEYQIISSITHDFIRDSSPPKVCFKCIHHLSLHKVWDTNGKKYLENQFYNGISTCEKFSLLYHLTFLLLNYFFFELHIER